jgi:hypothetical protein
VPVPSFNLIDRLGGDAVPTMIPIRAPAYRAQVFINRLRKGPYHPLNAARAQLFADHIQRGGVGPLPNGWPDGPGYFYAPLTYAPLTYASPGSSVPPRPVAPTPVPPPQAVLRRARARSS